MIEFVIGTLFGILLQQILQDEPFQFSDLTLKVPPLFKKRILNAQDFVTLVIVFEPTTEVPPSLLASIDLNIITDAAQNIRYVVKTQVKMAHLTIYTTGNDAATTVVIQNICNAVSGMIKLYAYKTQFTLYYVLVDVPKMYNGGLIGRRECINSGYTDVEQQQICIFRSQEVLKVTIHELIHLFNADAERLNNVYLDKFVTADSLYSPREGYTEFLARIIFTIWSGNSLQQQFHHTLHQAAKILHYNGWQHWAGKCIHQETYAFEYYVLSATFMWSMAHRSFDPITVTVLELEYNINSALESNNFHNCINVLLSCSVFDSDLRMTTT